MTWPSSPQQPGYPEQPGGSPYPGYSLDPQQYPGQPTEQYPGYQPAGHQPNYPSSGQPYPSYDYPAQQPQPGYQSPQQPQPGYQPVGQQPYPGYLPPTPPQKSNASKIALIMLAVVLLLAIGGGATAFLLLRDKDKPADPAAQSSPSATATTSESASPSPSETAPTQTTVVAPATLAGRKKLEHPELDAIVDEMITELERDLPMADKVVGGLYGNLLTQDLVMLVAAAVPIANPEREFDDAVEAMARSMEVTSMSTVDPGPLGGFAKCGDGESDGTPVAVCVWVDSGSLGILAFFNNDVDNARSEFLKARSEVQHRS